MEHAVGLDGHWWCHCGTLVVDGESACSCGALRDPKEAAERKAIEEPRPGVLRPVPEKGPTKPLIATLSAEEVFTAPLKAPRWVIPGLEIGPGRPTLLTGYSYSLKSLLGFLLALGVASGTSIWGDTEVRRCRVLILDYESGDVVLRMRRLALALGIDTAELARNDWLRVAVTPHRFLDEATAEAWLRTVSAGFGLVLVDTLRQAAPNADEDRSAMGVTLAVPTRVSASLGTAFVLVAHSGKESKDGSGDSRQSAARGSSAIYGQAGCVWHLTRSGEGVSRAHIATQLKRPTGSYGPPPEPLTLNVRDDYERTLTIKDYEGQDLTIPSLQIDRILAGGRDPQYEEIARAIVAQLAQQQPLSVNRLAAILGRRKTQVAAVVADLVTAGTVHRAKGGLCLQPDENQTDDYGLQEGYL